MEEDVAPRTCLFGCSVSAGCSRQQQHLRNPMCKLPSSCQGPTSSCRSPWFSPHDGRIRIHVSIGFSFQGNQTSFPIHSMYGIYAYIDPPNHPNVGIYGIHGASGYYHISYGSIAGHRFGGHGAPSRGLVIMSLVLKRACWSQAGCFIWRPIPCAQSWPLSGSGMALTMKRQQLRERDSVMVRMADTSLGKQSEILA